MKRKILLLAACLMALTMAAQTTDNGARNYAMRYEKAHLFLEKDSGFNVVDYDVEWPGIVDFGNVVPLKRYVSRELFGCATASLDSAVMHVYDEYGQPVSGMFKTIPDDHRFCYVTVTSRLLSYRPGRWIAFSLERKVEPEKLSAFKAEHSSRVIVYDLARGKVLHASDMLRKGALQGMASPYFYDRLFAPLGYEAFYSMLSANINGLWIDNGQIHMTVDAVTPDGTVSYATAMPYDGFSDVLTKDTRRMVSGDVRAAQPHYVTLPQTFRGDSIYNNVEVMPEFKGGQDGLRQYMSHLASPDVAVGRPSRVFVTFVVDKQGGINDVSVITPVSPAIDRHAAGVIKGMPAFTPGTHNGKPVCVRLIMPVSYKP